MVLLDPAPAPGVMEFQALPREQPPPRPCSLPTNPVPEATHMRPVMASCLLWAHSLQEEAWVRPTLETFRPLFTDLPVLPLHRYVWEKDGATLAVETNPRVRLDRNGSLHISQTWSGDIGTYTCRVLSAGGNDSRNAHLRVR